MAIQNRRGVYSDFTPTKMVPGEFAVVNSGDPNSTSGKGVYISFADGQAKRLVMEEDVQNEVAKATEDIAQELTQEVEAAIADDVQAAQTAATNASTSAQTATTKASEAAASATQAAQTVANIVDNTLTQTGKAADAKVTGDELAGLKEDLTLLEDDNAKLKSCFVEDHEEGEQVTLTNEANVSDWASGASLREGLALPTISDGVASLVNNGTSTLSPYAGSNVLISGTIIVGFKFRFVKLDPTLSDPEDFKIIIGQSNSREYSPNFGEWIDYSDVFTIGESELKRIRLSARNFPSSLTSGQFKLEIKDMYVYDATGVSAEMRTYIQSQQSVNYQDGTVTYGEASVTSLSPDVTLSLAGKAADSKAVGDAISDISGDLSTVSNVVETLESDVAPMQDAIELFTDELSATLTDLNAQANIFKPSSSTWEFSSLNDGVYTFVPMAGADVNVYGSNPCALGTGKWLVSFKYRLTKIDAQLSDPTDIKVILGSSESYTYEDYQFDTWTEFTKITETNLTRVYLSVRGFATAPTSTQVKLEIKEFYIYNLANVDGGLYSTIIAKQNEDYKSGTVTYTKLRLSEDITGSFGQINVKNYGVKGDGVTDDTNAINALFASQTGNFYFPTGTYKISGTIALPGKSSMYGDGDATVIDMYSCDNLTQCVFRGGTSIYPYILISGNHTKLHDFKLIGNNTTQEKRHAGVLVMDAENCFISNLTVYNINYYPSQTDPDVNAYGICILRSYRAYVDHCYVEQCGYECIGIADMSHHCVVKNCIAKNGWRTCIQVHRGAYDVDIIGNQMIQNAQAWDACFTLHGLTGDNLVRNLRIADNTFEATVSPRERLEEYAAVVQLMSYCDGLWFVNNRIISGDRDLCAESSVTHLYLIGNLFQCSDQSDYRLKILSDSPVIVGNILENTSGTTQTIPASAAMSANIGIS